MKYGLNRVDRYMKKLTLGVPTTLHVVLNNENVPDCKNAFLRERVKSTQPSRFRQNIVIKICCWESTLCVHLQKIK